MNLRQKFSLWIIILLAVVTLVQGGIQLAVQRKELQSELIVQQKQLLTQLVKVCQESLYQDQVSLFNYLKSLQGERGFVSAAFIDKNFFAKVHSDPQQIGKKFPLAIELEANEQTRRPFQNTLNQNRVEYISPVLYSGESVGAARLVFDRDVINKFLLESLIRSSKKQSLVVLGSFIIGILGAFVLSINMVRPIKRLVQGMRGMSKGQLEPLLLKDRKDELGWMGAEMNKTIGKLKELDEMKRVFVASITHELRSPLVAIHTMAGMYLDGTVPFTVEHQREMLLTVRNNSIRLMRLVDSILTSSKMESGRIELVKSVFDIKGSINEIAKLYEPLSKDKKIRFDIQLSKEAVLVNADKEKIMHILVNLVSNAFKFTDQGGITVRIEKLDDRVTCAVMDTGPGIPERDKQMIFEKFSRSLSTLKKTKGTGLGLFIAKGFADLHGGDITVTDNPKGGSIFTLILPRSA